MALTESERKILDWLDEKRKNDEYRVAWSEFEAKVEAVVGQDFEDIDESVFRFNLYGVTVTIEDGEKMYPVRDLEQGITRGYSTD